MQVTLLCDTETTAAGEGVSVKLPTGTTTGKHSRLLSVHKSDHFGFESVNPVLGKLRVRSFVRSSQFGSL